MAKRQFEQGKSTYRCEGCGKLTRDTGMGEEGVGLCAECYELAEIENSLNDGDIDEARAEELRRAVEKKHRG